MAKRGQKMIWRVRFNFFQSDIPQKSHTHTVADDSEEAAKRSARSIQIRDGFAEVLRVDPETGRKIVVHTFDRLPEAPEGFERCPVCGEAFPVDGSGHFTTHEMGYQSEPCAPLAPPVTFTPGDVVRKNGSSETGKVLSVDSYLIRVSWQTMGIRNEVAGTLTHGDTTDAETLHADQVLAYRKESGTCDCGNLPWKGCGACGIPPLDQDSMDAVRQEQEAATAAREAEQTREAQARRDLREAQARRDLHAAQKEHDGHYARYLSEPATQDHRLGVYDKDGRSIAVTIPATRRTGEEVVRVLERVGYRVVRTMHPGMACKGDPWYAVEEIPVVRGFRAMVYKGPHQDRDVKVPDFVTITTVPDHMCQWTATDEAPAVRFVGIGDRTRLVAQDGESGPGWSGTFVYTTDPRWRDLLGNMRPVELFWPYL